jgi:hypothetical protein
MDKNANIGALAAKTRSVYEQYGLQYDAERSRLLFEKKWLRRFENLLPASAAILDAGCGGGEPIGRYFIEQGYGRKRASPTAHGTEWTCGRWTCQNPFRASSVGTAFST